MTKITNETSKSPTTTTTISTTKHDWCNLDNYEVAVQHRLNSSKDIIAVDEIDENTYEKAKSVCEDICGRLYFPSTLKENGQVQSVLNRCINGHCGFGHYGFYSVWLRMTYNETAGLWYDPDNKEDLTFLNFDHHDKIHSSAFTKEHHAVMSFDGDWWSKADNYDYVSYVLCELT